MTISASPAHRMQIVLGAIALIFAGLLLRGALLAAQGGSVADEGSSAENPIVMRADFIDRDGELLVRTRMGPSLAANPSLVWDSEGAADKLVGLFPDLDRDVIVSRLSRDKLQFVWLKRGLSQAEKEAVLDLELEGLIFREERVRFYPNRTMAGHVLGYVGTEKTGMAGLEYALEDRIKSDPAPVRLTIDAGVQFALEDELARAGEDYGIIGAAGIVLEARTGAIRAMASWPAMDPASPPHPKSDEALDRVVGAVYDLGSVFKPLIVAAAMEAGIVVESDRFDFREPLIIQDFEIKDLHPIPGPITLTEIVSESSNKGTVVVARALGSEAQIDLFQRAGLMQRSPIELTASEAPLLPPVWDELAYATTSYGHGISVSPLAFASAFAAFANNGEMIAPTLLEDNIGEAPPQRVFTPETVRRMNRMLRKTVTTGTGKRADIPGYRIAGKTGTAEKSIGGEYIDDRNITSFAALFPADRPEYVVLIVLDEPKAGSAGGRTAAWNAAPTAGRVIDRIAPHLGVMPVLATTAERSGIAPDTDRSAMQ
ncbi:MAG: penicillin-binding protein 2 [Pseudomonadota bacterium]